MADLTLKEAYLVNLFVICILYGIYFSMFMSSLPFLLRSSGQDALRTSTAVRRTMIVVATVMFVLETTSIVLNLLRCMNHFISMNALRAEVVGIGLAATYLALPLSDAILLYRCWIVWNKNGWIMVLPGILWLAVLAGWLGELVNESLKDGKPVITSKITNIMVNTMGVSGFALNLTLTGLITARIWRAKRDRKIMQRGGAGVIEKQPGDGLAYIQRVIIEYGLIWTITHGILVATSFSKTNSAIIATGVAKHMSGIAFSLMILRVSWARSQAATAHGSGVHHSAVVFSHRESQYDLELHAESPTSMKKHSI